MAGATPYPGPVLRALPGCSSSLKAWGFPNPPPPPLPPPHGDPGGRGAPPLTGEIHLATTAKKWIYATVESDVPWIQPLENMVSGGQAATVRFRVLTRQFPPETRHTGTLTLLGNGGQRLHCKIQLQLAPAPHVLHRFLQPVVAGSLTGLLLRLGCILPDYAARYSTTLTEGSYTRKFMLVSFWVMILLFWFLIRKTGKPLDYLAAAIVGSLVGLVLTGTLAQLLPILDQAGSIGHWPGAPLLSWGLFGAGIGLLVSLSGSRGRALMATLSEGLARLATWFRLPPLARFLGA